jgi:aerobic carbon-monoxide dehydrogenase small subunit
MSAARPRRVEVVVRVNGVEHDAVVEPRTTLADVLRDEWGLTGTKLGCEHGVCGACTVLSDGQPVRSCLVLAQQGEGTEVTTVEGLAEPGGPLSVVQDAFREAHGLQCGFCTSGMLLTATALLEHDPEPDEALVRDWMHGNLCRCTGYDQIVDSVLLAAHRLREGA